MDHISRSRTAIEETISEGDRLRWIELVSRASLIIGQKAKYQYEYLETVRRFTLGVQWMASMPYDFIRNNRNHFDGIENTAAEIIQAYETNQLR